MREIQEILSAKCRVTDDKSGPRQHEQLKEMVGNTGMFTPKMMELNTQILKRIGVVKL